MTRIGGVFAALLAPRNPEGNLDCDSFSRQVDSLAIDGITGYAVNGATGEFSFSTPEDLEQSLTIVCRKASSKQLVVGIGAGDVRGTVLRGRIAADHRADAVLLSMPPFFSYRQDDLCAFSRAVADALTLPVLLYNLPQFTTGIDVDTTLRLLEHPNIIGIKDSSGSLDMVRAITAAGLDAARFIGNDSALCDALEQGLCDGVISGVACTLPRLMTRIFQGNPSGEAFTKDRRLLDEFIEQLSPLPVPWGLKVTSDMLGFTRASYPFPLSNERALEIDALRNWFRGYAANEQAVKL